MATHFVMQEAWNDGPIVVGGKISSIILILMAITDSLHLAWVKRKGKMNRGR